jgi:hypothetical protein
MHTMIGLIKMAKDYSLATTSSGISEATSGATAQRPKTTAMAMTKNMDVSLVKLSTARLARNDPSQLLKQQFRFFFTSLVEQVCEARIEVSFRPFEQGRWLFEGKTR